MPTEVTVLVADDEPQIRRLVRVNLEKAGNRPGALYRYKVVEVENGEEALAQVPEVQPGLIILDVMMPKVHGFAVLAFLKGDKATCQIPVIMLTAKAQDADVYRGWQTGVDSYITKPFNPQELISIVERILDAQQSEEEGVYNIS